MISTLNSHCFGSIFSALDKTTLSIHLVSLKVSCSSHETRRIIPNMKKQSSHTAYIFGTVASQAVLCKHSVIGTSTAYPSELCKALQYTFPFIVIGPLQCSFLQTFYAAKIRHTCHVPTPFKVFPMLSSICARKKVGVVIPKFYHCNRNCESSIVLNRHDFEPITSNDNNYI